MDYAGGYVSARDTPAFFSQHKVQALLDDNLAEEHKEFIREVRMDSRDLPTYRDKHCGLGGVYVLRKSPCACS